MVVFRILQGIGGGTLIPLSQAILRETFPAEEQATAMSIFGLGVILGPAFGPTLGGWLTDNYSWPWIFYINVPVGILNILLVMRFIEDPPYLVREKGRSMQRASSSCRSGSGRSRSCWKRATRKTGSPRI